MALIESLCNANYDFVQETSWSRTVSEILTMLVNKSEQRAHFDEDLKATVKFSNGKRPELNVYLKEGKGAVVGYFTFIDLPYCCPGLMSVDTGVIYSYRGKKISYLLQDMKTAVLKTLGAEGAKFVIATVDSTNEYEIKGLMKYGWHKTGETGLIDYYPPPNGYRLQIWMKTKESWDQ